MHKYWFYRRRHYWYGIVVNGYRWARVTNMEHKVRVGQIPGRGAAETLGSPRALYHIRPEPHSPFNVRLQSCLAAQSSIELRNIWKQSQHPFTIRLFIFSLRENFWKQHFSAIIQVRRVLYGLFWRSSWRVFLIPGEIRHETTQIVISSTVSRSNFVSRITTQRRAYQQVWRTPSQICVSLLGK